VSDLATAVLIIADGTIHHRSCAAYIHALQCSDWYAVAFTGYTGPVTVAGGKGRSNADAARGSIKIGSTDRHSVRECEHACLHELAHIVTPDCGPDRQLREPTRGRESSKGHHHAWRVNFVLMVRKTLGDQAAQRLISEFGQWGLQTSR
jgi:hypothetical protein